MQDPTLSYEVRRVQDPYAWALWILLWLWAILNGIGSSIGIILAVVCYLSVGTISLWMIPLGTVFLACGIACGVSCIAVCRHAICVIRREPGALERTLRTTLKFYGVFCLGIVVAIGGSLGAGVAMGWDLGVALIGVIAVPFAIITSGVLLTIMALREHMQREADLASD